MRRKQINPLHIEYKSDGQKDGLEYKSTLGNVEVKAEGEGGILHIRAYALAYGNVDSWGDVILKGAADDYLAGPEADRTALCWQHNRATVIGKITAKGTDDYGMWIEADILPTTAGKDAAILLKAGAVKEVSIGYRVDKCHFEKRTGEDGYQEDVRIIEALTVYEVSPVTVAANPKAVIVSAKNQGTQAPAQAQEEPDKSNSHTMTPDEIKAMRESIEKAAGERAAAEVKAAQEKLQAAQERIEAQEKSIDNLDKSAKALQATVDDLKKSMQEKAVKGFEAEMRARLEEHRDEIKAMFDKGEKDFSIELELKTVYDISTGEHTLTSNTFLGIGVDPTIHAANPAANVFIEAFGIKARTANKLGWIEASEQNGCDYVAELAQNTNKSDVAFAEKTRAFGKLAHTMRISTEFTDWFEQLYQYCIGEGRRMILAKFDTEIWSGLGNDTANAGTGASPNKVYGIKSYATAFSALGAYEDANEADVAYDAAAQIAKEGFSANAVFVTWATYAKLFNLKDKDGNRLFNQATQKLGAMRVYPTTKLSSGEMLVADTTCCEPYAGNSFELEFIRNGAYDAYDVYYRLAVQNKITTPGAKGLIYVAALSTSIAAINVPSAAASTAAVLADVHDSTNKTLKTEIVTG